MAAQPCSTASAASSAVATPLRMNGNPPSSFSASMVSHVTAFLYARPASPEAMVGGAQPDIS